MGALVVVLDDSEPDDTLLERGLAQARDSILFRRVLVPLDGSLQAERILQTAARLSLRAESNLGLVRVVNGHCSDMQLERDEAREYLERIARRLRRQGVRVTWEVRIGEPGEEIARAAETTAADLILMVSTHYGDAASIAGSAISASRIPVIVAKVAST